MTNLTESDVSRHDELDSTGWQLIEGEILLHDAGPARKPGWLARRKLQRAISCFEQALAINGEGWQSMWALGKIYQRLGDRPRALRELARAHRLNPAQPDVAREAGIAACAAGNGPGAVQFCKAAVAADPEDAGLLANLALAHLIAGNLTEAARVAQEAVGRVPDDPISNHVAELISEVESGRRPQPKTLDDVS